MFADSCYSLFLLLRPREISLLTLRQGPKYLDLRTGHKDDGVGKKMNNCWFKVFEC